MNRLHNQLYKLEKEEQYLFPVLLLFLLISLFLNLGDYPLKGEEPRRAFVAMEMMFRGNIFVPTELGEYYYGKPPFYNWLLILAFKIFGNYSEFAVRFFTMISLLVTALLLFQISKKQVGERLGVYTAFFYLTNIHILFYFSYYGEIDLFYVLITFLSLYSIYYFEQKQQWLLLFLVTYFLTAIGFLTKGLPSIAFTGLTIVAYLILRKRIKILFSWQHVVGGLLFLTLIGAYFFIYNQYADVQAYLAHLFWESSHRTVLQDDYAGEFWSHLVLYPLQSLMYLLPSSIFIIYFFNKKIRTILSEEPFVFFALTVFLANFPVYWFSPGASERYLAPLYPFAAIFFSYVGLRYYEGNRQKVINWLLLLLIIGIVAGGIYLPFSQAPLGFVARYVLVLFSLGSIIIGGLTIFIYKKFSHQRLIIFILILVWLRFTSAFVAVPIKAGKGKYLMDKNIATKIYEITEGKQLKVICENTSPSVVTIYYLERKRKEMLTCEKNINENTFYLASEQELTDLDYQSFYAFTDSNNIDMQVVKFK